MTEQQHHTPSEEQISGGGRLLVDFQKSLQSAVLSTEAKISQKSDSACPLEVTE